MRPQISTPPLWHFPLPEITRLANGMDVWAYHLPGQHIIHASLSLRVPVTAEPKGHEGLGRVLLDSIDEGTQDHPGDAFNEKLKDHGATIVTHQTSSSAKPGFYCASPKLEATLGLFAEAVRTPELSDSTINRQLDYLLRDIQMDARSTPAVAYNVGHQFTYADGTRAHLPLDGTTSSIMSLTPEDVRDFHSLWNPMGATLTIAGDLPAQTLTWIERFFGRWEPTALPPDVQVTPHTHQGMDVVVVDVPHAAQTEITVMTLVPDGHDERSAALALGTQAIGGGTRSSRFYQVLREQKGYTYSTHARIAQRKHQSLFTASTASRHEVAVDAALDMVNLLAVKEPLTDDEVRAARDYKLGSTSLYFQTSHAICALASSLASADLDPAWVNLYHRAMREATTEQVNEVFRDLVRLEDAVVVLAGHGSTLCTDLEERGIAYTIHDLKA